MKGIIYASNLVSDEIQEIISKAQDSNILHGITGFIFLRNNTVVQYFEGDENKVDQLWENICQDDRHIIIRKLPITVQQRLFSEWGMQDLTFPWPPRGVEQSIKASKLSSLNSLALYLSAPRETINSALILRTLTSFSSFISNSKLKQGF